MTKKIAAAIIAVLMFCNASNAQRPEPITTNPGLKPNAVKMVIADTTAIKITKLEAENKKLSTDIAELKKSVLELQKDNVSLKLLMQGVNHSLDGVNKLVPIAYGVFDPVLVTASNFGQPFNLTSMYGCKKTDYSFGAAVITLNKKVTGSAIVITSYGIDAKKLNDQKEKNNDVLYEIISPNQIRFIPTSEFKAPFSFIVFGNVEN